MMLYAIILPAILTLVVLLLGIRKRFLLLKYIWDPKSAIKREHILRVVYFSILCACVALLLIIPNSKNLSTVRTSHILFLVDTSKSMGAERPLGNKNRIDRSEEIIKNICAAYPDAHTALYAFTRITRSHAYFPESGDNIKNCGYIKKTLDNVLRVESVAQEGSNIAGALSIAAIAFPKEARSRVLILFTDGEYTEGEEKFVQALSEIKRGRIQLVIVGVGEENGAFIPIYNPETGDIADLERTLGNKKVTTYLRTETLRTLANEAGGKYFDENERDKILAEIDANLTTQKEANANFYSVWKLAPLSIFILATFLILKPIT